MAESQHGAGVLCHLPERGASVHSSTKFFLSSKQGTGPVLPETITVPVTMATRQGQTVFWSYR